MKLLLAQIDVTPGDVPENVATLTRVYRAGVGAGADVVITPELSDTAYDLSQVGTTGGAAWTGVVNATQRDCHLLAGLSQRADGGLYNTLTHAVAGEAQAIYAKRHLIGLLGEDAVMTPGTEAVVTRIGDLTWGLMICYDLRFPEQARELVLQHGAEVLCYVAAWPTPRHEHWRALLRARAIENQCYVVAVNRVGTDAGNTFCGSSMVVDPVGELLVEGGMDEAMLEVEIDSEHLRRVRTDLPFLADA